MRTVAGGDAAQPTSTLSDLTDAITIQVADASDVLQDLTEFAVSLEYDQQTDMLVDGATIVFRRLEDAESLVPLMTANPPVALGRRVVVLVDPGSGTDKEIFRGRIDKVDWPERFGDVTIQCRDQSGVIADTWIETGREYGDTTGDTSLETVMQAVATDNLTSPPTLNFPVATSAVVQHVEGDPPYGPTEMSVLDALRDLAESIGWTMRWRNFDASASDWKLTVFEPARTKTDPDHTFGTDDYWDVTQMSLDVTDIRNVVRVYYVTAGAQTYVTVKDDDSITAYGRRYMAIVEGSDSPVNNATHALALANAALSDLSEPDALLEIQCPYFWPGELGVDLYRFTANEEHFTDDQDLAPIAFRHRIAVGERPTTWILCRGKPSGGVLMWRRRPAVAAPVPVLRVANFREVARSETTVTLGWDAQGDVREVWLYTSTPAQPLASDPWASLNGVPTARLTGDTEEYEVDIPDPGLVTYGRLVPVGSDGTIGNPWDFTVRGNEVIRLVQRAQIQSTSSTQIVVRVAVANPIDGGDVTIAYEDGGLTVSPPSEQTISAASVTEALDTTGYVDFTITRPAFQAGTGRVTFTASSTDRSDDVDAVDVPAQERDTQPVQVRIERVSESADSIVVDVKAITPNAGATCTVTVSNGGLTVTPTGDEEFTSTTSFGTTGSERYTITRDAQGGTPRRVTFTVTASGFVDGTDGIDVMPKMQAFKCRLYKTSAQTLNAGSNDLTWDVESFDVGSLHDTSSNTNLITVPTGGDVGTWLLNAQVIVEDQQATDPVLTLTLNHDYDDVAEIRATDQKNEWINGQAILRVTAFVPTPVVGDTFYLQLSASFTDGGTNPTVMQSVSSYFEAIHIPN